MHQRIKRDKVYYILAAFNFIFGVGLPVIYSKDNLILSIVWTILAMINAILFLIKTSKLKRERPK